MFPRIPKTFIYILQKMVSTTDHFPGIRCKIALTNHIWKCPEIIFPWPRLGVHPSNDIYESYQPTQIRSTYPEAGLWVRLPMALQKSQQIDIKMYCIRLFFTNIIFSWSKQFYIWSHLKGVLVKFREGRNQVWCANTLCISLIHWYNQRHATK